MPEKVSNSLINLGDLAIPADTLIKKVSDAIGVYFEPFRITRAAKAEAEAAIIRTQGDIQVTELKHRAIQRFIEEEAQRQNNMEVIVNKAIPLLTSNSKPEELENDWITNFFDKCRIVSDEQMQELWAKILSGEANAPGSYSKRTVNFLSDLEKSEALLFSKLCGFGWQIGDFYPLIYNYESDIYKQNGIDFVKLTHLESIGLIQFNSLTNFERVKLPKKMTLAYYGTTIECELPKDSDNSIDIGKVILTKTGLELIPICESKPVKGFMEFTLNMWRSKGYLTKEIVRDNITN